VRRDNSEKKTTKEEGGEKREEALGELTPTPE